MSARVVSRAVLVGWCVLLAAGMARAQQAQPPAPAPATGAPAAQPPAKPRAPRPAAGGGGAGTPMTVTVTDQAGEPLVGIDVNVNGPVTRSGSTQANGVVRFSGMRAGTYRLRFEGEGAITLERDVTVRPNARTDVDVTLSPAPEPAAAAAPDPAPAAPAPAADNAPPGEARHIVLADFIERNFVSGKEPRREDEVGCTASARTTLIQLRENTSEQSRADADEVLYVIAGEGTLRLGNRDVPLSSSAAAIVPRGTVRGLTRKGRNPLILLSVVSGKACTK